MCLCIPMLVVISCSVLKWMPLVFHTAIVLPFFRRISYILFILLFVGETFESDSDGFPLFYFEIFIIQIAVFLLFLVTCKLCSTFFFCTFRLCSKELLSRFFVWRCSSLNPVFCGCSWNVVYQSTLFIDIAWNIK